MTVATEIDTDTGQALLPDIGELSYNGVVFGPLFETTMNGQVVKDNAGRTTKYIDYTLTVDGYCTLKAEQSTIDSVMVNLRRQLTACGGTLQYVGRGFGNLIANFPDGVLKDVAWGPIPELLEFQPLGAGRSAKIRWSVRVRVPEVTGVGGPNGPVLQFNEESVVTYDEDGFSHLSIRGTLEIPLTRTAQAIRSVTITVDQFRRQFLNRFATIRGGGIDLTRFRVSKRNFHVSRDKRTMEWDFSADELPYQNPPYGMLTANGSFTVSPFSAGMGLVQWNCVLRGSYVVPNGQPRRIAWDAFLALLRRRMGQSFLGAGPLANQNPGGLGQRVGEIAFGVVLPGVAAVDFFRQRFQQQPAPFANQRAWLINFTIDEGLYLDSKRIAFSATWKLVTTFSHILVASGVWKRSFAEENEVLWATSIQNISGSRSWLPNVVNPALDVIVDFGGPVVAP